jgi:predicted RNA-binding Zn-ribbon protein involved in translation (DUF1610 family)
MERQIQLKENTKVTPCPKCGNNTRFTLRAERCAEDLCETYVVCKCGHEATGGDRYENVWGETDNNAALVALDCWNDAIAA